MISFTRAVMVGNLSVLRYPLARHRPVPVTCLFQGSLTGASFLESLSPPVVDVMVSTSEPLSPEHCVHCVLPVLGQGWVQAARFIFLQDILSLFLLPPISFPISLSLQSKRSPHCVRSRPKARTHRGETPGGRALLRLLPTSPGHKDPPEHPATMAPGTKNPVGGNRQHSFIQGRISSGDRCSHSEA